MSYYRLPFSHGSEGRSYIPDLYDRLDRLDCLNTKSYLCIYTLFCNVSLQVSITPMPSLYFHSKDWNGVNRFLVGVSVACNPKHLLNNYFVS